MREEKRKYDRLKSILESNNLDVNERVGKKFIFPTYRTKQFMITDIEVLDLDVRSYNCLKRAGIHTLGDLVTKIHCSADLKKIRNCGANSASNIMDTLFAYQFEILDASGKFKFIEDLVKMNCLGDNMEEIL